MLVISGSYASKAINKEVSVCATRTTVRYGDGWPRSGWNWIKGWSISVAQIGQVRRQLTSVDSPRTPGVRNPERPVSRTDRNERVVVAVDRVEEAKALNLGHRANDLERRTLCCGQGREIRPCQVERKQFSLCDCMAWGN